MRCEILRNKLFREDFFHHLYGEPLPANYSQTSRCSTPRQSEINAMSAPVLYRVLKGTVTRKSVQDYDLGW
jgi:hypothetical protein